MSKFGLASSLRSLFSRSSGADMSVNDWLEDERLRDDEDEERGSAVELENGCHPRGMSYCPDCHGGDYLD